MLTRLVLYVAAPLLYGTLILVCVRGLLLYASTPLEYLAYTCFLCLSVGSWVLGWYASTLPKQ